MKNAANDPASMKTKNSENTNIIHDTSGHLQLQKQTEN